MRIVHVGDKVAVIESGHVGVGECDNGTELVLDGVRVPKLS